MNHADTTNVLSLYPVREACRVAPFEAKWVHQADQKSLQATTALRSAAPGLLADVAAAEHDLREQLHRYAVVHGEHRALGLRDFHPMVPERLYWLLLLAAALLESPVNKAAMSFLAMSDTGTWMVAAFLSALNVVGASYSGKALRQVGLRPSRDWLVLGAVVAVFGWSMTALAGMRAEYVALQGAAEGMPVSEWAMSTLLAIQALFFVVGASLSFAMVPADAQLQCVLKDKKKLRGSIDALLRRRTSLAARHDRLWLQAQQAVLESRAYCQALVGEYRDENFSARGTRNAVPSWMRRPIDPAVFTPVELGPRLLSDMPTLEQLLSQIEEQADPAGPAAETLVQSPAS